MSDIEKVIKGLEKGKKVIEKWIPMFEQYNSPFAIDEAISLLKEQKKHTWIPFAFRPMTDEEVEYYDEYYGAGEFEHIMVENTPDDGQEILVSWNDFVWLDTYCADHDGVGLEGHGEIEEGMAWMPLPEPYVAGDQK